MAGNITWRGLPEQALSEHVSRLEARIARLEHRTSRIPILDVPPDIDDPTNMWFYEDGRLLIRASNGTIFTYRPEGQLTVPVLSTSQVPTSWSNPIHVWIDDGSGRLRVRGPNGAVASYSPDAAVDLSGTVTSEPPPPKPPAPTLKTYTTSWSATWSGAYEGDNSRRTDNNHLYYGRYDSNRGRMKSLIGFDYSSIRSALTGATVKKVEVYLYNIHAYQNSGVYIKLGMHTNASRPSSYTGAYKTAINSVHWGKPESAWNTVSNSFGEYFKSGAAKGILIDQGTDSISYYGYAAGVSDGSYGRPQVRITYTK